MRCVVMVGVCVAMVIVSGRGRGIDHVMQPGSCNWVGRGTCCGTGSSRCGSTVVVLVMAAVEAVLLAVLMVVVLVVM